MPRPGATLPTRSKIDAFAIYYSLASSSSVPLSPSVTDLFERNVSFIQ